MILWYIFSKFGMLYQEKSGNPGLKPSDENTCLLFDYFRGGLLKLRVSKLRLKNFSKKLGRSRDGNNMHVCLNGQALVSDVRFPNWSLT
jgi:hypothetical protein